MFTARVCSTTGRLCFDTCLSVCPQGGYPYPIMLCNITQNSLGHTPGGGTLPGGGYIAQGGTLLGGTLPRDTLPRGTLLGGTQVGYPLGQDRGYLPGGYSAEGYPGRVPPGPGQGGTLLGGYPGRVPPWARMGVGGTLLGGTQVGYPLPLGQVRTGGTQVGQQKEYSLHGGQYASCVHAGGPSCFVYEINHFIFHSTMLILDFYLERGGGSCKSTER